MVEKRLAMAFSRRTWSLQVAVSIFRDMCLAGL